jgi:prepilin-type N-terminal cleavage/methylation domain-containing protein
MRKKQLLMMKTHKGFTLIEFIVIMMIFSVMVGVALFNFNGFRSVITLDNLAHDIAISIRQIQSSAGASLSNESDNTREIPRGIYFGSESNSSFSKEFILFEDTDEDGIFTNNDRAIDIIKIQTADFISSITYDYGGRTTTPIAPSDGLGITFGRYKTDALFSSLENAQVADATAVTINLQSPSSGNNEPRTRSITISKIGQVSIR